MSLGIDVSVQSRQVREARREVENLNRSLRETEAFEDLAPGKDGLNETSALLKQVTEDLRRMKGLSVLGERQGGLLGKNQFQEAAILSKRIGENFGSYTKDLQKARQELGKLIAERAKLEKTGGKYESPADFERRESRLSSVQREIEGKQKSYDSLKKHERTAEELRQRGEGYSRNITGFGEQPDIQRGGSGWGVGKMFKYGAALLGGVSILGFLQDSMHQAAAVGAGEADLRMRGAYGGFRHSAARYGYTPLEAQGMQDTIGRSTGLTNNGLDDASLIAAKYGRRMGIGGEAVAGYMGGIYSATGASVTDYKEQLKLLHDTAVALGARGRIEEVLRMNQQVMVGIVHGRGGKELSGDDMTGLLAMQMGLWSTPGQIGKGASGAGILSSIDQSIRSGGNTPGQQIFLAQALGIDKVNSMSDLWDYRKKMSDGLTPDNLKSVLSYADKMSGQRGMSKDDARIFSMMNVRDTFGLNEYQTEAIFRPEFRRSLEDSPDKAIEGIIAAAGGRQNLPDAMSLPGNAHRRTVAGVENAKVDVGEALLPVVDSFKNAMLRVKDDLVRGDVAKALIDGLSKNPIGQLMVGSLVVGGLGGMPLPVPLPGRGGGGKILPFGPVTAGVAAGAYVMSPNNDQVGEDAVASVIARGGTPQQIKAAAEQQTSKNHDGGLVEAIWELVHSLNAWMRTQNGMPSSPVGPPPASSGRYP